MGRHLAGDGMLGFLNFQRSELQQYGRAVPAANTSYFQRRSGERVTTVFRHFLNAPYTMLPAKLAEPNLEDVRMEFSEDLMNSLRRGEVGRGEIRDRLGLSDEGLVRMDLDATAQEWWERLCRVGGAYHEIGHAWVATHVGWRVDGIDLEETETRAGRTRYTYEERTAEALAMFTMAGKVAGRLVLPRTVWKSMDGHANDVPRLRKQLSEMGCSDVGAQTKLMHHAERRIKPPLIGARAELDFLAAHLLEAGSLSGDTYKYLRNAYAEVMNASGR